MEVLDGEWCWTRSVEIPGMLDGETRAGEAEWERSDGDIGWGHEMGTWQRGTPTGKRWMEMLDGDVGQGGIFFFTTFHYLFHLFSRK